MPPTSTFFCISSRKQNLKIVKLKKMYTKRVELAAKTRPFSNNITFWGMCITAAHLDTMLITGTDSATQLGKFQTLQRFWAEIWKAK
jgi:hypothetical protein